MFLACWWHKLQLHSAHSVKVMNCYRKVNMVMIIFFQNGSALCTLGLEGIMFVTKLIMMLQFVLSYVWRAVDWLEVGCGVIAVFFSTRPVISRHC